MNRTLHTFLIFSLSPLALASDSAYSFINMLQSLSFLVGLGVPFAWVCLIPAHFFLLLYLDSCWKFSLLSWNWLCSSSFLFSQILSFLLKALIVVASIHLAHVFLSHYTVTSEHKCLRLCSSLFYFQGGTQKLAYSGTSSCICWIDEK